jgi:hypothetical protein
MNELGKIKKRKEERKKDEKKQKTRLNKIARG